MLKKIKDYIVDTIREEHKFIIVLLLITIILNIPLNYYITVGGGISDASNRIDVEDKYKSKGSFNISYVTQLQGNVLSLGLSYIIPSWERESANLYKVDVDETKKDVESRSVFDLNDANDTATYWAYTLANKSIKVKSKKLYVVGTSPGKYPTKLKILDEMLSIDNNHYDTIDEYVDYIQTKNVGDEVEIKIKRNDKEKIINSKIYELDNKNAIGIYLEYKIEYETSPKVNIKFKSDESGPSGGLITTLEMYNKLTKKDLTKGKTIAGTGTIEPDGTIGEIGGIEYKIAGAAHAKADVFLSPGGDNYKEVTEYAKKHKLKIKIIKVDTIKDAIDKLERLN